MGGEGGEGRSSGRIAQGHGKNRIVETLCCSGKNRSNTSQRNELIHGARIDRIHGSGRPDSWCKNRSNPWQRTS
jgi:hypothetical protein